MILHLTSHGFNISVYFTQAESFRAITFTYLCLSGFAFKLHFELTRKDVNTFDLNVVYV